MSRLNKDQRAALIAEFEQGKESSNPDFYCLKDKSGKVTIRRKKQPVSEEDADYLKIEKTMKSLQQQISKLKPLRPTTPAPEVVEKHTKEPKANLL